MGDFTGDGKSDLVGRKRDGTMWVFPGDGTGQWVRPEVGSAWQGYDAITAR